MELVQSPLTVADLASYPGPAQLSVACSTRSDGKLGGAWVRGKLGPTESDFLWVHLPWVIHGRHLSHLFQGLFMGDV